MENNKGNNFVRRVLIGSPVHQSSDILNEFLISLDELYKDGFDVDYYFIDDNLEKESSQLLKNFKDIQKNVYIIPSKDGTEYICDDYTHRWNETLVQKVTRFKNGMINFAVENKYDYLFLIDSDIVLHPKTLNQLVSDNKDIISNIFWTQWSPRVRQLPQVWLKDAYTMYDAKANQNITTLELERQTESFIELLKKPGVYKVGGLGACTLISRDALLKNISFDELYNISFWGEDRHFCIRAVALGLELYVDTHYPAYHIYREDLLAGVKQYKENILVRDTEILGAKIVDIIVEGISTLGTYSYLEETTDDFMKYFTFREGTRLREKRLKERKKDVDRKIIKRTKLNKCTITFYDNNTVVKGSIELAVSGYENNQSFYQEYLGKCEVIIQPDNNILISNFNIENNLEINFVPLIRSFRDTPKITLSMIVKNEENRYLRSVLESAREYIDDAVIIDDGSTDGTVELCKNLLEGIPLTLIENKTSSFSNEIELRKQQWFETIRTKPDWIIFLDADEIFEDKFAVKVKELVRNIDVDGYLFRLYDFWNEEYFRDDALWNAHNTFRLFMIRYQRNFHYKFQETAQHCGRIPYNATDLSCAVSYLRLKHCGWAKEEDRIEKYNRYMELDPEGKYGSLEQYQSILDLNPILTKWNEKE